MSLAQEDRSATGRRRVFHLLDAIRGLAALAVAQRHAAWLTGVDAWPSTYLAVDLFFVLSGFVIAYSYEDRLRRGMTWRRFMGLRLIRLYPLYGIGLTIGFVALVGHELQSPARSIDWVVLPQALLSAALLLPNWGLPAIVGPRWSLTYELVANAGYAAMIRRLTQPVLWSLVAGAGFALVVLVDRNRTIDLGWEYWQAPIALARVCFSFGCGVLLFRIHAGEVSRSWAFAMGGLILALSMFAIALLDSRMLTIELLVVFLAFPLLTLTAASIDVRGSLAGICGILGATSYAIYVIHQPTAILYEAALRRLLGVHAVLAPWAGWSLLALLILAAWLLDRWYDRPVRRRLVAAFTKSADQSVP